MNANEYRYLMERKFNAIVIPVFLVCLGTLLSMVSFVWFGIDPRASFAVAVAVALITCFGAMVWWSASVLPKMRELEKKRASS